jgi:hypothetical protein
MIKLISTAKVAVVLILLSGAGGTIAANLDDQSAKERFGKFAFRVPPIECNGGCSLTCRSICQPGGDCSPLFCCWDGASNCWSATHSIE